MNALTELVKSLNEHRRNYARDNNSSTFDVDTHRSLFQVKVSYEFYRQVLNCNDVFLYLPAAPHLDGPIKFAGYTMVPCRQTESFNIVRA